MTVNKHCIAVPSLIKHTFTLQNAKGKIIYKTKAQLLLLTADLLVVLLQLYVVIPVPLVDMHAVLS